MADLKISQLTSATTPLAGTETLPIVQSGATKQVSVANLTAGRAVSAASLSLTTTPLPATSGGTGLSAYATNALLYSPTTTSVASATKLTYNGTTLNINTTTYNFGITFEASSDTSRKYQIGMTTGGAWSIYDTAAVATRFSIDSSGNTTIGQGNLVIGTSGKGIDFSATSGTGTSELLSDYEEGTWTPTVTAKTGAIILVGTVYGSYTVVGRQVTLNAKISITTNGTGAGAIIIAGMPFTPNTSSITYYNALGINDSTAKSINGFVSSANIECRHYDGTYPVATGQVLYITTTYFV